MAWKGGEISIGYQSRLRSTGYCFHGLHRQLRTWSFLSPLPYFSMEINSAFKALAVFTDFTDFKLTVSLPIPRPVCAFPFPFLGLLWKKMHMCSQHVRGICHLVVMWWEVQKLDCMTAQVFLLQRIWEIIIFGFHIMHLYIFHLQCYQYRTQIKCSRIWLVIKASVGILPFNCYSWHHVLLKIT